MTAKEMILQLIEKRIKLVKLTDCVSNELNQLQKLKSIIENLDNIDAQDWLGNERDIWHHPRISDRTQSNNYELAELMNDFCLHILNKLNQEI